MGGISKTRNLRLNGYGQNDLTVRTRESRLWFPKWDFTIDNPTEQNDWEALHFRLRYWPMHMLARNAFYNIDHVLIVGLPVDWFYTEKGAQIVGAGIQHKTRIVMELRRMELAKLTNKYLFSVADYYHPDTYRDVILSETDAAHFVSFMKNSFHLN